MTYVCEKCGFIDNVIWKPLFWKIYGSYCSYEDFLINYPGLAHNLEKGQTVESEHYIFKRVGKSRDMVHRFPKVFLHLTDRKLYEKTPSEKGFKEK